ncbi:glycosyltransferase [Pelagibacteraceae bacterium]|nr:glycosyltransferase [Pelagibacteraceae bacterium]
MSSFNVVQIIPSLDSGGAERGTIEVANYLSELKLKNNIISNGGRLINEINKNYTNHHRLSVHSKNFFTYPSIANQLKKLITNENINIVHVRSRAPAWILSFIKNKNFKTISTFHNVYSGNSYLKKFYNKQLSKVDQIVAISNYVKNEIAKKYNLDTKKIKVINRGVDIKYFEKKILDSEIDKIINNFQIDTSKKLILYPARLTKWKGQLEFLDIFNKMQDNNYILYFVGDTKNQSYTEKLRNKIQSLNLNKNCKIIGNLSRDDLKTLYYLSSIITLFPLQPEGFGRIISEALIMKKKILSFNYGGVRDQLEKLDNIYKVDPHKYSDIAEKLRSIIRLDDEKFFNISSKSKEYISKSFSKSQMVKSYVDLYEKQSI